MTIAFIGTGIMGGPMAGHLLDAGHTLTIHTRTRSKAEPLLSRGAKWADTPRAAAEAADIIFICVSDTPDVEAVVLGNDGILHAARDGMIVVDHSTISPSATRKMAAALAEKGVRFIDAPVSGGDVGAKNATLSIMAGGDEQAFEIVRPLLEKMGKTITYCGPGGNGQLTKLVNQILGTVTNMAVCEALVFAEANGLDMEKTINAVAGGAAGSWLLSNLGPRMVKDDFEPGFMVELQTKDLRLVREAADEAAIRLRALEIGHERFSRAQNEGFAKAGTQAVIQIVRDEARAVASRQ